MTQKYNQPFKKESIINPLHKQMRDPRQITSHSGALLDHKATKTIYTIIEIQNLTGLCQFFYIKVFFFHVLHIFMYSILKIRK